MAMPADRKRSTVDPVLVSTVGALVPVIGLTAGEKAWVLMALLVVVEFVLLAWLVARRSPSRRTP